MVMGEVEAFLNARKIENWNAHETSISLWRGPYLIDNVISREFTKSIPFENPEVRAIIRDQVEGALFDLPSAARRSWMREFDYLAKQMISDQLVVYAPNFVRLSHLMPLELKKLRRQTVATYLANFPEIQNARLNKHIHKFTRSSVLIYSSTRLIQMSDKFVQFLKNNRNQSFAANRTRTAKAIAFLQKLSDRDLQNLFEFEALYLNELSHLKRQSCFHGLEAKDIVKEMEVLEA